MTIRAEWDESPVTQIDNAAGIVGRKLLQDIDCFVPVFVSRQGSYLFEPGGGRAGDQVDLRRRQLAASRWSRTEMHWLGEDYYARQPRR